MVDPVRMSNVSVSDAAVAPGGLTHTTKEADMLAYDRLGPACQRALREAIIGPWSAEAVLRQHFKRGWNPKDPVADQRLAEEFIKIDLDTTIRTTGEGHPIRDTSTLAAIANQSVNGQGDNPSSTTNSPGERG